MSVERREGDVGDVVCLWRERGREGGREGDVGGVVCLWREREGGRVMWEM